MGILRAALLALSAIAAAAAHAGHGEPEQVPFSKEKLDELQAKWGQEWGFSGIGAFAHLPYVKCLTTPQEKFDIAVVGAPFDTAVSYRPGARFGPRAIRAASARQTSFRGFNPRANFNPYQSWATILDCGDIPITPFDNMLALEQMTQGFTELISRSSLTAATPSNKPWQPKLLTLGGDHAITLPTLRALSKVYGQPISVLHFDAHLDTWLPTKYPSHWLNLPWATNQSSFNHGSFFHLAAKENLTSPTHNLHAGLRTRLSGDDWGDYEDDTAQGWARISADDIDAIGTQGIIDKIIDTFGTDRPVYLSVDIDVLDPGLAPGTGTPEPGGWTSRELIRILRGIEGLNLVGGDVVEVAPAYDGRGEETALMGAQVIYELLTSMVKRELKSAPPAEKVGKIGVKRDEL